LGTVWYRTYLRSFEGLFVRTGSYSYLKFRLRTSHLAGMDPLMNLKIAGGLECSVAGVTGDLGEFVAVSDVAPQVRRGAGLVPALTAHKSSS
jgi:hypothetical protein